MAKKRCPKCGERNDVEDKHCFYCEQELKFVAKKIGKSISVKKFLKSELGLAVMILLLLPLFALSATAGMGYFKNNSHSASDTPDTKSTSTPVFQDKQSTNPKSTTTPQSTKTNEKKSESAGTVCTKTILPHSTTYAYKEYMYVGETKTWPGRDGWVQTCTVNSKGYKPQDVRLEPYNTTVVVGTRAKTPTVNISSPDMTAYYQQQEQSRLLAERAQRIRNCQLIVSQASGTGSSAYQRCSYIQ